MFIRKPHRFDAGLTLWARFPTVLWALIAADMNELGGEQVNHLREHVLEEFEGLVVASAVDVLVYAPTSADRKRPAGARQRGIRRQGGDGVAGHFDFRNDGYVATGGVGDNLPDILLGVKATVPLVPLASPGTDCGKLGVLLDFDPPALVFGQVPMKNVHLVVRQQVDVSLDELFGHEVPAAVEQHAAPRIARFVDDPNARDPPGLRLVSAVRARFLGIRWQKLANGLNGVEEAVRSWGAQHDGLRSDRQSITLIAQRGLCAQGSQ